MKKILSVLFLITLLSKSSLANNTDTTFLSYTSSYVSLLNNSGYDITTTVNLSRPAKEDIVVEIEYLTEDTKLKVYVRIPQDYTTSTVVTRDESSIKTQKYYSQINSVTPDHGKGWVILWKILD